MLTDSSAWQVKGNTILDNSVSLGDFATKITRRLLYCLNIKDSFLNLPPKQWTENEDYQQSRNRIQHLQVINDTAEPGVKLFEEFNLLLTNDEEEKQCLLQIIEENRKLQCHRNN